MRGYVDRRAKPVDRDALRIRREGSAHSTSELHRTKDDVRGHEHAGLSSTVIVGFGLQQEVLDRLCPDPNASCWERRAGERSEGSVRGVSVTLGSLLGVK